MPTITPAAEVAPDLGPNLRECVRQATSPLEVAACEAQARRDLSERITRLNQTILTRLAPSQRKSFEANTSAWEQFVVTERAMFEVAFGARPDGLGEPLKAGALNELLEQRVERLVDYLSSLPN